MSNQFEEFKKEVLSHELTAKKMSMSKLEFDKNGILSIGGVKVPSESGIEKKLFNILSIKPAFVKKFGKLTGEESKNTLINIIKNALTIKDFAKSTVTVLGNSLTKSIVNILPGEKDYITNSFAFKMIEYLLETNPLLEVKSTDVKKDGGFSMNLVSKTTDCVKDKNGKFLENEEFNPGISLFNDPENGIYNMEYFWRLICSNGLMGSSYDKGDIRLNTLSKEAVTKFVQSVKNLKLGNMNNKIVKAIGTKASFNELNEAKNILLRHSTLTLPDIGIFLPEFTKEASKLMSRGHDYEKFSNQQLACVKTNTNIWDAVNRVTYFGSHNLGFDANFSTIQARAGALLSKKVFDTENLILLETAA